METGRKTIEWSRVDIAGWKLHLARTDKGLCYAGSPGGTLEELKNRLSRRFPDADFSENPASLAPYAAELEAYSAGGGQDFSLPTDVKGTPFQEQVWDALKQIPYGHTSSYSEIAAAIGRPSAVRAVGTAIGANPLLITVPCHRVIGKNGAITGYRGGLELKQFLLDLETKHLH